MKRLSQYGIRAARLLMAAVFLLNGLGIIDQSIPAKELTEHGAPGTLVPLIMWSGRVLELVAGFALIIGFVPQLAALALLAFLVQATLVAHSFWTSAGTPAFQGQLINFSKNMAICGGLFIASTKAKPESQGE